MKVRALKKSPTTSNRGRFRPHGLTAGQWRTVLNETRLSLRTKNLPTLAAGVTYFLTLALFPFMAASVAIAALLITPEQLQVLASTLETYLPEGVSGMIIDQLHGFVGRRTDNSLAAIIATAVALVGASGASRNMVIASNVAYSATESRGWLVRHVWGVAWVVAGIGFCLGIVTLLSVNYDMLTRLNLSPALISLVLTGRWLMLFLVTVFSLAVFYRYGPDRPNAKWQWVSWGAIIAATVWLVGTTLFFMYIQNFASLTQTYTVFAGIIILMMWMNISVLVILLGAEINYQLETISNRTISPVDKA